MVHQLHEGGVCLADRQTGPAAPHVPAENTHQDREGKQMWRHAVKYKLKNEWRITFTHRIQRQLVFAVWKELQTELKKKKKES